MNNKEPIFILGPPRAGSTYLAHLLNCHPNILMTNETRVMIYVTRMIGSMLKDDWCILNARSQFAPIAFQHAREMVIDLYRTLNAKGAYRWGDKFPHYADVKKDPDCLAGILRLFPQAQFIGLVRDPRAVTASIVTKAEALSLPRETGIHQGIDVWCRCVEAARAFGAVRGDGQYLSMRYEDLMNESETEIRRLFAFLGEPVTEAVRDFLATQRKNPTAFSLPTNPLGPTGAPLKAWRQRLSTAEIDHINHHTTVLRATLGYTEDGYTRRGDGNPLI